ncbi:hypothetical protein FSP39_008469 [Pinctada imbricata]|uniref:RING finger protein 207 n=1 Tax=Pinctada imbricata TaxID=66713 RepID=A0AA88YFV8_PINIB|nr:hypothetical protein FSP39_008469 [Pinctada imbricata]
MSGEIFLPPENIGDLDLTKWNPLLCYLCNEKYEDPRLLSCFHSFCSKCLSGRVVDGQMTCPLCGSVTTLKDGEQLPVTDKLLKFLVDQSANEDREPCANCDQVCDDMFFCNTCAQPLCLACRDATHKAKMFARHSVVLLSKRTKGIHKECSLHQEPFILFSTEKKTMLCIKCFRDMKIESRAHCVDMETAYKQGCKKLDQSMQAIRELQTSVRDAIFLLKALLEEIQINSQTEKSAISELYKLLQEKISETQTSLLNEVDVQYNHKEKSFKGELSALCSLLPTLHTHLVTCTAFYSSANKYEFLDLAYVLMDRLKSIIHLQHPLNPSEGGQICTDFKAQFAKCLEPLVFPYRSKAGYTSISTSTPITLSSSPGVHQSLPLNVTCAIPKVSSIKLYSGGYVQNGRHAYSKQMKLTDIKGTFADHCIEFDTCHRELSQKLEKLKTRVQELQRDLTVRRCLSKTESFSVFQEEITSLEEMLEAHYQLTEQKQPALEKYWEEIVQRIAHEQELYQVQLHDVLRLKQETGHVRTIVKQLGSYITSIAAVTQRISPMLGQTSRESLQDNQMAALFEEISTMTPDSQHRVDAIRIAQEERETVLTANRTNPLDEELIKTKGMLKAPSARREGVSRKNSTKRDSKEIKEMQLQVNHAETDPIQCDRDKSMSERNEDCEKRENTDEKRNIEEAGDMICAKLEVGKDELEKKSTEVFDKTEIVSEVCVNNKGDASKYFTDEVETENVSKVHVCEDKIGLDLEVSMDGGRIEAGPCSVKPGTAPEVISDKRTAESGKKLQELKKESKDVDSDSKICDGTTTNVGKQMNGLEERDIVPDKNP